MHLLRLRPTPLGSALLLGLALVSTSLTGCIVAGASSSGGWFIWPGGLGLVVIVIVAALLLRRR